MHTDGDTENLHNKNDLQIPEQENRTSAGLGLDNIGPSGFDISESVTSSATQPTASATSTPSPSFQTCSFVKDIQHATFSITSNSPNVIQGTAHIRETMHVDSAVPPPSGNTNPDAHTCHNDHHDEVRGDDDDTDCANVKSNFSFILYESNGIYLL